MESYFLTIVLRSGERLNTGRWSFDENEIHEIANRLAITINCKKGGTPEVDYSKDPQNIALAALLAIGTWAIYYRISVDPFCSASAFTSIKRS